MKTPFLSIAPLSVVIVVSILMCRQVHATPPPPPPPQCVTNWCESVQAPAGTVAFTNVAIWPGKEICFGSWVDAWPEAKYTCSDVVYRWKWSPQTTNCPPVYYTNYCQSPFIVTNWWVVNHPGYSGSGAGSYVGFYPTNCGEGTITFYAVWRNWHPCTGQWIGGGTISKSVNFKVIRLEIAPSSTNALINKCQDPNRTVTFCLTNSCFPGGVNWTISPTLTNGATISGSGGCATVNIGDAVQGYTITATSNDNTNCVATASLQVSRDCVCTNHTISANPIRLNGQDCAVADRWEDSLTTTCGDSVVLECIGYVRLELNGSLVGHCPYNSSIWDHRIWKCQCEAMIMKTQFAVVNTGPASPGFRNGKDEFWSCAGGLHRDCWKVPAPNPPDPDGPKNPRPCDGGDSIAGDDPF